MRLNVATHHALSLTTVGLALLCSYVWYKMLTCIILEIKIISLVWPVILLVFLNMQKSTVFSLLNTPQSKQAQNVAFIDEQIKQCLTHICIRPELFNNIFYPVHHFHPHSLFFRSGRHILIKVNDFFMKTKKKKKKTKSGKSPQENEIAITLIKHAF